MAAPKTALPLQGVSDLGPRERQQHGAYRLERTGKFGVRIRNVDSSALDGLYYRGVLSQDEHTAGSRLVADCLMARMMGPPGLNLDASTRTQWSDIPDGVAKAIGRINEAMDYMIRSCGRASENVVLLLVTRETVPQDIPALKRALAALAEHYYRPRRRYRFDLFRKI
jgi:hypothetical protein